MKKLLFAVFLILVSPAWALTFKSDGSVVQKDGRVVTKTTQERYAEALSDYRAGRTVSGFPFNPRKLTFNIVEWDEIHLLKSLEYEGERFDQVAGDTVTKSQTTWIA